MYSYLTLVLLPGLWPSLASCTPHKEAIKAREMTDATVVAVLWSGAGCTGHKYEMTLGAWKSNSQGKHCWAFLDDAWLAVDFRVSGYFYPNGNCRDPAATSRAINKCNAFTDNSPIGSLWLGV